MYSPHVGGRTTIFSRKAAREKRTMGWGLHTVTDRPDF